MRPAAMILAGGLSRRMGTDKAFVPLAGKPLIAHVIDRLGPQAAALGINANGEASRFAAFGLPVFADRIPGFAGPLAGILTAMEWGAGLDLGPTVVTAAGDTPFLPMDYVARLTAEGGSENAIAIATSKGKSHNVCALWPTSLADDLRAWLGASGDRSVAGWLRRHRVKTVDFAGEPDPFFNVNAPPDLAAAELHTSVSGLL